MTGPTDPTDDAFEDRLRQVLMAEASTVEPSPEALNLIRERTERNRGFAWFGLPWLRPVAAVAGAVMIAASVVVSSPQVRDQVLEFVPAGADRHGAPPEHDADGGGVAAPDPSSDSTEGSTQQPAEPPRDPESSPSSGADEDPAEEGVETASTCSPPADGPAPSPSASAEEKDGGATASEEECDPSEEPTDGEAGGGDESGSGGGGEAPGAGGGDEGAGGGGEETSGGGSGSTGGDATSNRAVPGE
ncbi:hypothetical protein [Nocardiopsis sp. NPDC055824]